jgi:SPP1 family phage portal protein
MVVLEGGIRMLSLDEIQKFIKEDEVSEKKKHARKGVAYYDAQHDIKNYKMYYVDGDGVVKLDTTRSNIKIPHPFFTELTDQEVQYMLSNDNSFIIADDEKLQTQLDEYFGDEFKAELQECMTKTITQGFNHMYAYKSVDDRTKFITADSMGVIEVLAKEAEDKTDHVIYWYVDKIDKKNKKIKKIQVWDKTSTYYYVQIGNGEISIDNLAEHNPRPHIAYKKEGDEALYYEGDGGFGFVPFFRLDNNHKQISGLHAIKELIDDYDLMACGLSNNLQDISEGVWVVSGYKGGNVEEIIQNIKTKKHIAVSENGGIDIKTIDIPYKARKAKLELDEINIYRFGMGFNSAQVGDGNITNIVIKSRYALLDLKCNKLEVQLKKFLRKLIKIALDEINASSDTDYQSKDVKIKFIREVMTNAQDNAEIEKLKAEKQDQIINTLLAVAAKFDDETIMKKICDVLDIDYDEIKDKLPDTGSNAESQIQAANKQIDLLGKTDE